GNTFAFKRIVGRPAACLISLHPFLLFALEGSLVPRFLRIFASLLFSFLILACLATELRAQQGTAAIVGNVTDPQGAAVSAAKVVLNDPAKGFSRETQADEQGRFQFLSLQPSTYIVRVEAKGFKAAQTERIEALVSTTQKISLKLELGTVTDTVTVTEGSV